MRWLPATSRCARTEVTPVLKALRSNGIDVVAIHHHMTGTEPTVYFLHYWGRGPARSSPAAFRAAVDQTGDHSSAETVTPKDRPAQRPAERSHEAVSAGSARPGASCGARIGGCCSFISCRRKPSNLRVRTWRRLQQLGAIAVKQAVYVLPDSPSAREDFEWLKTEIETGGGRGQRICRRHGGYLVERRAGPGVPPRTRERLHHAVACRRARAEGGRRASGRRAVRVGPPARIIDTFRQRLAAIEAIDFFGSAGRDRVATLVSELQQALSGGYLAERGAESSSLPRARLLPAPHVGDEASSGHRSHGQRLADQTLHRPRGSFRLRRAAASRRATRSRSTCSAWNSPIAESGARLKCWRTRFAISDSAVERLATIVHDLDLKDAQVWRTRGGHRRRARRRPAGAACRRSRAARQRHHDVRGAVPGVRASGAARRTAAGRRPTQAKPAGRASAGRSVQPRFHTSRQQT